MAPSQGFTIGAALVVTAASWFGTLYLLHENRQLEKKIQGGKENSAVFDHTKSTTAENENIDSNTLMMQPIGVITSPFPQRAGCPRQGTLAPNIVSHLNLNLDPQTLDGLTGYSHVWIVFGFHLNPRGKAKNSGYSTKSKAITKVRPPRAPAKMGVLATRSPHRPNAVGLSLALVQEVRNRCIVLHGLDLVDGTPVYDVKPYVPWDRIPNMLPSPSGNSSMDIEERMQTLVVPGWVSTDNDELTSVSWSSNAKESLRNAHQDGALSPLYPPAEKHDNVMDAISEIIAQDPRALRDGRGTTSAQEFQFTFCSLRVTFGVEEDRVANVTNVELDQGDLNTTPGSYPHNLALRRQAEQQTDEMLQWAYPVREGIIEGLYKLQNGETWEP